MQINCKFIKKITCKRELPMEYIGMSLDDKGLEINTEIMWNAKLKICVVDVYGKCYGHGGVGGGGVLLCPTCWCG